MQDHPVLPITALSKQSLCDTSIVQAEQPEEQDIELKQSGTPSTGQLSARPPPFASLYFPHRPDFGSLSNTDTNTDSVSQLDKAPAPSFAEAVAEDEAESQVEAESKAALAVEENKGEPSKSALDESDPPPPYTEDVSPLELFSYIMSAASGAASLITQVQQTGPSIGLDSHGSADDYITLDLRGTRFTLSRAELEELPQFVLLYLFPSGGLPGGHMNNYHETDVFPADYDPLSLQYMLDFFNEVAQSLVTKPSQAPEPKPVTYGLSGGHRGFKAGIIILREDLDFYVIPPRRDIQHDEMIDVKRAAAQSLLKQDGIFSGLRKSDEDGTTEQHLIEMLTTGGFNHDDRWNRRAGEPNKAVICSLALARLRTNIQSDPADANVFTMADKLSLFEKKPARRCWWEGVELDDVKGVEGKLKVWIRRVWTLETKIFRDFPDH